MLKQLEGSIHCQLGDLIDRTCRRLSAVGGGEGRRRRVNKRAGPVYSGIARHGPRADGVHCNNAAVGTFGVNVIYQ